MRERMLVGSRKGSARAAEVIRERLANDPSFKEQLRRNALCGSEAARQNWQDPKFRRRWAKAYRKELERRRANRLKFCRHCNQQLTDSNCPGWQRRVYGAICHGCQLRRRRLRDLMKFMDHQEACRILDNQGLACAICHRKQSHKALARDHDHGTGKLRGFLCDRCNRAIGLLGDSPVLLRAAADYLERGGVL